MRIEPVTLREGELSMKQEACLVDLSRDRRYVGPAGEGAPVQVPGARVIVSVPFEGEAWLLQYRPSTYATVFPHGGVAARPGDRRGEIVLTFDVAYSAGHAGNEEAAEYTADGEYRTDNEDSDAARIKGALEREINLIGRYLERTGAQLDAYNRRLPGEILKAVKKRRRRTKQSEILSEMLGIPQSAEALMQGFAINEIQAGSATGTPLEVSDFMPARPAKHTTQPARPPQPGGKLPVEPGISEELYELILGVLRHALRTYETTPGTYSGLDEEAMRDLLLAHLNSYFQGGIAAGEVFRRSGKTDICVQDKSRAAFVGECKVWGGAGQVAGDVDQLLGYLTWRDSKAALIVFNKTVAEFSAVVGTESREGKLPGAIRGHRCFVTELPCEQAGEWRYTMRSAEDKDLLLTLHVFAVNIYSRGKGAGC